MRQIAATRRRDRLLQQIASCDMWKSLSLRQNFVAAICRTNSNWFEFLRHIYRSDKMSASSFVAACVRKCDKSLRQNLNQTMKEQQFVSRHVKFELVYISSLPKWIAWTEQVCYRSDLSQHQCRRGDLSPRCVAAIFRIVCRSLKDRAQQGPYKNARKPIFPSMAMFFWKFKKYTSYDRFVWWNPDQQRTNQNAGIYLKATLPCNKTGILTRGCGSIDREQNDRGPIFSPCGLNRLD